MEESNGAPTDMAKDEPEPELNLETEEAHIDDRDANRETEVAPALIAVHPLHSSVAVAVGSDLRVFDLQRSCLASLANDSPELLHKDSIRAIRFSDSGKFLVSAGDDKLVKMWCSKSWQCILSVNSEKRVTAVALSKDEKFVCFADKFGVVWVVDLKGLDQNQTIWDRKPVSILGHYCSIITSLEFSLDGQFLLSADRDFKIRVTVFPRNPLIGAHEIQSFCLGHSERDTFVSCLALLQHSDHPQGFLLSGSGDSKVCLWEISSGSLLSTCEVGSEVGYHSCALRRLKAGVVKESNPAVTDICTIPNGSLVAVALQGLQGIILLNCDLSARTLSVVKVISITEETFIPTSLGCASSGEYLWMTTGVSNLPGLNASSLARVRVITNLRKTTSHSAENEPIVLEDNSVPGGKLLLEKLQGRVSVDDKVLSAAAEAVRLAMTNLLTKKQYSEERRDFRKRGRNDKKMK
ncbi:hypothetical protein V2J09_022088 [Rumex salicifolius]